MSGLCAYSDILGKPNEGIHSISVAGLAAVDLFLTAAGAFLINRAIFGHNTIFGRGIITLIMIFIILIICGVFAHDLFCVNTRLNAALRQG